MLLRNGDHSIVTWETIQLFTNRVGSTFSSFHITMVLSEKPNYMTIVIF